MQAQKIVGQVAWFDPRKGVGFISRPCGADVFVHHTKIEAEKRRLRTGDVVEFEIDETSGKPQAHAVRVTGHVTVTDSIAWRQHG